MKILGIHDGHNASACLLEDGEIKAGIQEERLNRTKNWFGFPSLAISKVLDLAKTSLNELDYIALNGYHMPYPKDRQEIMEEYRQTGSLSTTLKRFLKKTALKTLYQDRRKNERLSQVVKLGIAPEKVTFVEHHLAHAAAAYFGWANFQDDVLILTNDGAGDGLCATVNIGRNGQINRIAEVPESESIGNIYAMITFMMGMVPLEHEYKLMGMAPYAPEKGTNLVFEKLIKLMSFDQSDPLIWKRAKGCPETYYSYDFFKKYLELARFDWICGGLQKFTKQMLVQWVRNCIKATGLKRLALSGGVFMNVKANKAIMELPEVKSLFIFPSCGDETNALGAAYYTYASKKGHETIKPLRNLYWGGAYSEREVEKALKNNNLKYQRYDHIEETVASLLAEGKVVARFKGQSEFGARALGNRSILANASKPEVIRIINDMIKSRDFWMPFAPSILKDRTHEYIVNPKNVPSPYMIMCYDTTEKRQEFKAAIHPYDFTARPQEVTQEENPDYYSLLKSFEQSTGSGVILNTSFNLHGYPIVETPQNAISVFLDSGLQYLAIENFLVTKKIK